MNTTSASMATTAVLAQPQRCGAAVARRPDRMARCVAVRAQQQQHHAKKPAFVVKEAAAKLCSVAAAATLVLTGGASSALANAEKVAEFPTSGLIFRDTVKIIELKDEQVDGVVIYLTDYQRSLTERLAKDPFSDPSQASLTCLANKPATVKDEAAVAGSEGKEIFSERKGLNLFQNKNLRVRRIYDEKNKVLIYVAYSTRFTGAADEKEISTSRYRTSVCAVPLASAPALVPVAAPANATATEVASGDVASAE